MNTTSDLNLQAPALQFTLPFRWWGWLILAIGAIITIYGIYLALTATAETYTGWFIAGFGLLIMAVGTPTSLSGVLYNLRKELRPEEVDKQKEEGGVKRDWWMNRKEITPTSDPNDWVFPAPGPASWNMDDRYCADASGEILAEHPSKIGTPVPSTITSFALWVFLGYLCIMNALVQIIQTTPAMTYIAIGLTLILVVCGYFYNKKMQQMADMPTSLVRSMSMGSVELVGQVRLAPEGDMDVNVDGDPGKSMSNMVGYRWTHSIYVCKTVTSTDSDGNTTTREECHWREIGRDEKFNPFILHDGSGGVRIESHTFSRIGWGNHLKQWYATVDTYKMGKDMMTRLSTGLLSGGGKVKQHRWTLWGLRTGNPVYLTGEVTPRTEEEIAAEGIDKTSNNAIAKVLGTDGTGFKARLDRGTELTNLGSSRSSVEMVVIPFIMFLGSLILLGL